VREEGLALLLVGLQISDTSENPIMRWTIDMLGCRDASGSIPQTVERLSLPALTSCCAESFALDLCRAPLAMQTVSSAAAPTAASLRPTRL
jgi:hypothetical protein